jgi:hypothetical protein
MLAGREGTILHGTLGAEALFALQKQFAAFTTALAALGTYISSHA